MHHGTAVRARQNLRSCSLTAHHEMEIFIHLEESGCSAADSCIFNESREI